MFELAISIDTGFRESYWRQELARRSYYDPEITFEKYRIAIEFGLDCRVHHLRSLSAVLESEKVLASRWERSHSDVAAWNQIKDAVLDAWLHAEELIAFPFSHFTARSGLVGASSGEVLGGM